MPKKGDKAFDKAPEGTDPFANPSTEVDPFGSSDPFANPSKEADSFGSSDPFANPSTKADPFGSPDPFANSSTEADPFGSSDPFANSSTEADPFGSSDPFAESAPLTLSTTSQPLPIFDTKENQQDLENLRNLVVSKYAIALREKVNLRKNGDPSLRDHVESCDFLAVLEELNKILTEPNGQIQLKAFLHKRWDDIQGNYFSYTSIPYSNSTKICCAAAEYLAKNDSNNSSALSFLMHTVKHYDDVATQESIAQLPLNQVLPFHISSDNHESLIPINLLAFLNLESDISLDPESKYRVLVNPFLGDGRYPITENEKERLVHHSSITEEIISSKEKYKQEASTGNSLYSAIIKLIAGIRKEGEHGIGSGTAGSAGEGAYDALDDFRKYWKLLTSEQQALAYTDINFKQAMENKIFNDNFNDCIESLAKDLDTVVADSRLLMTSISLDPEKTYEILVEYLNKFDKAKGNLTKALTFTGDSNPQYNGRDHLFLSLEQIEKFVSKNNIKTPDEVSFLLKGLKPTEIEGVCDKFKERMALQLRDAKGFFTVLINLDIKQLESFSRKMADKINSTINLSNREILGNGLNLLSDAAANVFLESAMVYLAKKSQSLDTLEVLSDSKKAIFLDKLKSKLAEILKTAADFAKIMSALSDSPEQSNFFNLMKDKLPKLINNSYDFAFIMKTLSETEKSIAFNIMKIELLDLVNDSSAFERITGVLPDAERGIFFDLIKENIINILTDKDDFISIIEVLPEDKKPYFLNLDAVKEKFAELIKENYSQRQTVPLSEIEETQISVIKNDLNKLEHIFSSYSAYLKAKIESIEPDQSFKNEYSTQLNETELQITRIKALVSSSPETAQELRVKIASVCENFNPSDYTNLLEKNRRYSPTLFVTIAKAISAEQEFISKANKIIAFYKTSPPKSDLPSADF